MRILKLIPSIASPSLRLSPTALLGATVVLSLLVAGAAVATPLAVTESIDFSNASGSPTAVGTLDIGVNTISGAVAGAASQGYPGDTDYFSVILPVGLSVSSMSVTVPFFANYAGGASQVSLVSPNSGSASFDATGTFGISPFTASSSPIKFGVIPAENIFFGGPPPGQPFYNADGFSYTLLITVVPEPGTALLLGGGLLGLARRRRR